MLVEAGYPSELAERIAHSEADLHDAVELVCRRLRARDRRRDPALSGGPGPAGASRQRPQAGASIDRVKVESTEVDGRKVFSVSSFNQGIASWLERLPTVWVEGEVTELRRQERWAAVFLTLKDPENGACLAVQMPRGQFDALGSSSRTASACTSTDGRSCTPAAASFHLRALTIERFGLGAHLVALERLKRRWPPRGCSPPSASGRCPRIPRLIGLVTGNDAAAKRDVLTAITARFPPANVLVAETYVQGARAARAIEDGDGALCDAGRRRDRDRPRRRQLRRPAALLRRAARAGGVRLPGAGRQRGRPRAGRLAGRPRRRRPRLDALGGGPPRRPRPRRAAGLARAHPARRSSAAPGGSASGAPSGSPGARERLRRAPLRELERRRARLEATRAHLRALSPQGDARAWLRDRPQRRAARARAARRRDRARHRGRRRRASGRARQ